MLNNIASAGLFLHAPSSFEHAQGKEGLATPRYGTCLASNTGCAYACTFLIIPRELYASYSTLGVDFIFEG